MTLARLHKAIACIWLLGASVTAAGVVFLDWQLASIVVAEILLTAHVWILAAEMICLWHVEPSPCKPPADELFRAWCGEVMLTVFVFCWRQPFRSEKYPNLLPKIPDGRRGVLLVHGLVCNRGFWNPWMARFQRTKQTYIAVNLEPVFGLIESYEGTINEAIDRLRNGTGLPPVVVAHSMGGLAVRHWLSSCEPSGRVHRIITIGTPHFGTWLARFSKTGSGRQMALGSSWLVALAAREAVPAYNSFTCFYGNCDNVVFPAASAQLPGADNRCIFRTAHVALAFEKEVFAETQRWLETTPVMRPQ